MMEEVKRESWFWSHHRFSIVFLGSVSIILVLLSMGFKNDFIDIDTRVSELGVFFSYLLMFLAGMYFAAFFIEIERWKKRRMKTNKSLWKDRSGQFSILEGFIIMWVFIGGGIVLTMALGTVMDQLVDTAVDMNAGIPETWNTLTYCMMLVTDLHLLLILMPIIGISIFVISVLQKTRYDQYLEAEEEEY